MCVCVNNIELSERFETFPRFFFFFRHFSIPASTTKRSSVKKYISTLEYRVWTGKPNPVKINSSKTGRQQNNYNISWSVDSYTPIEEFKLFYRKVPLPDESPSDTRTQYQWPKKPPTRNNVSKTNFLLNFEPFPGDFIYSGVDPKRTRSDRPTRWNYLKQTNALFVIIPLTAAAIHENYRRWHYSAPQRVHAVHAAFIIIAFDRRVTQIL